MNFRPALQIKTAIRAMQDVIIPAIDGNNKMATEQAGLVVAMLQLLARTLPLAYRYDRDELARSIALADELHTVGLGTPALASSLKALAEARTNAAATLERAKADPAELEDACRTIRTAISDHVTVAHDEAAATERTSIARLTLTSGRAQLRRERAWVISQGWESEPEKLDPIEAMI